MVYRNTVYYIKVLKLPSTHLLFISFPYDTGSRTHMRAHTGPYTELGANKDVKHCTPLWAVTPNTKHPAYSWYCHFL